MAQIERPVERQRLVAATAAAKEKGIELDWILTLPKSWRGRPMKVSMELRLLLCKLVGFERVFS
jgi:hypothetical protein